MIKDRIAFLQNELKDNEAALISSYANRLYYTGFSSSAGYVAVTKSGAWFLIDFRYFEKAKKTVESCEVILSKAFTRQLGEILSSQKIVLFKMRRLLPQPLLKRSLHRIFSMNASWSLVVFLLTHGVVQSKALLMV